MKSYQSTSLFHPSWQSLTAVQAWNIMVARHTITDLKAKQQFTLYGHYLISALRQAILPKYRHVLKKSTPAQINDLYHDTGIFYHQPCTTFHVRKIKANGIVLYAPMDDLENITYGQWKFADKEYSSYAVAKYNDDNTAKDLYLKRLIASLYLPASGQNLSKFDKTKVDQYARDISGKLKPFEEALILWTFANIRTNIINRCPTIFPPQEHEDPQEPQHTGKMWHSLHFDIAKSDTFKGFATVEESNLYDILDFLEQEAKSRPKQ